MGVIKTQATNNALITYAGLIIGVINMLFLLPGGLSAEEVGLRSIIVSSGFLVAPIVRMGFTKVAVKFYPSFRSDTEKDHGFLFFIVMIPLIGFLVFTLLFVILKDQIVSLYIHKSSVVAKYIWYIIPLTFFVIYNNILGAYSQVKFKITFPSFVNQIIMSLLMTSYLVLMNLKIINFELFIFLITFSGLLGVILNLWYLHHIDLLHLKPDLKFISPKVVKEIMIYGVIMIISGIGIIISENIGTLMLGAMAGLKTTAIFSIAYFMARVVDVPRRSVSSIAGPVISEAWHDKNLKLIDDIYKKTCLNQMIIGCFIFLLIWMNIDSIFSIMPHSEIYHTGKWVVFYIGLARVVDMTTGVNTEILINSDKFKFNLFAVLSITVLVVVLNYFLIPAYGIEGAAMSILFSYIYFNLVKFIFILVKFRMQPFTWGFVKHILIVGIVYLLVFLIPEISSPWISIILKSAIISFVYISLLLLFNVSEYVNAYYRKFIGVIIKKS